MKIKIAVIEDDKAIAAMYTFKLENSGYEVRSAHDGHAGLGLIEHFAPELILLDLRMPVMSGSDMLERLRQTEWGSKPRVIILTNISRAEAPSNLQFLNVDRYVVKAHHTPQQIVDIICEIVG